MEFLTAKKLSTWGKANKKHCAGALYSNVAVARAHTLSSSLLDNVFRSEKNLTMFVRPDILHELCFLNPIQIDIFDIDIFHLQIFSKLKNKITTSKN